MRKITYFLIPTVVLMFCLVFFTWNYLPDWVAESLSKKMKVAVSIARFNFTPTSATVYQTTIGNPRGSTLPKALQVARLKAKAPLSRLFKQAIILDEVTLSDVYLGLEFDSMLSSQGNWSVIMNNLSSSLSNSSQKQSNSLLIKYLAIENLKIDLVFKNDNKGVRHLKPIALMKFKNVSGEGGAVIDQLTNIVMGEILKEVFNVNNLKNMLNGILKPSNPGLSPLYNSMKSFFSQEIEFKP